MDSWDVRRILAGETSAGERLVQRYYGGIYRFLLHLTGNADDAGDLAQQTFVRLRENLASYREAGPFRSWLYRIAYREFLHWKRDVANRRPESLGDDVSTKFSSGDDALVLTWALGQLPDEQSVAFRLRIVDRLSVKEVAAVMDIPEGTVKSRCHLARQRLQELLAGSFEPVEVKNVV